MHYDVYGDGGRVAVLLHGWGASGSAMRSLCGCFKDCKIIVPDFYGHGESPHPGFALSLSDYVEAVREILLKEGVERAVLVGHSFGGRVAIKLGANYPELVQGIVLVNSAGVRPRRTLKRAIAVFRYRRALRRGEDVSAFGSDDYKRLNGAIKKTFVAVVNEDMRGILRKIKCPALVITGALDKDTPPRSARVIARRIKNSRLVRIKGAGHFSYLDAPNAVRRAIVDWQEEKLC